MSKKTIKISLSEAKIEFLKKELEGLIGCLNEGIDETTQKLGKRSLDYIKEQYAANKLSGHIENLKLTPYKGKYKYGFILSSGQDPVAIYKEFGTGIVGAENSNPLASTKNYEYNVPSPSKGYIPPGAKKQYGEKNCEEWNTPNTWWYWKNGKWHHTEGMKASNMYSSLEEELRTHLKETYQTSIEQNLKKY